MQRDPAGGPDTTLTARLMKPPGGGREARRGSGVTIHRRHLAGGKICVSVRRLKLLKAEQNVTISHLNPPFFVFVVWLAECEPLKDCTAKTQNFTKFFWSSFWHKYLSKVEKTKLT